jgi:hypothetical protein
VSRGKHTGFEYHPILPAKFAKSDWGIEPRTPQLPAFDKVHVTISSLRTISTYVLIVSLFAIARWLVIRYGKSLPAAVGERARISTKQAGGTALSTRCFFGSP